MSALDLAALRALATAVGAACEGVKDAKEWDALDAALAERELARTRFAAALSPGVVLALLDRLERAEAYAHRRAAIDLGVSQPASREAGEVVDAVLTIFGVDVGDDEQPLADDAAAIVQRAVDAAEERGAESEREQRAIERRHGVER